MVTLQVIVDFRLLNLVEATSRMLPMAAGARRWVRLDVPSAMHRPATKIKVTASTTVQTVSLSGMPSADSHRVGGMLNTSAALVTPNSVPTVENGATQLIGASRSPALRVIPAAHRKHPKTRT
jgi:hypothetical protein